MYQCQLCCCILKQRKTHPVYQRRLSSRATDQKHNQLSHIPCISVNYPRDQQTKNTISYHTSRVSASTILESNRPKTQSVIIHPMYQRQLSLRPTDPNTISYHTSRVSASTILETNRPKTQSVITHPMYQSQLSLRPTDRPKTQSVITHPAYQRQLSLRPTDRPKTQSVITHPVYQC